MRGVVAGDELADGAADADDAEDNGVDPTRRASESVTGAHNDAGNQGWDEDDELDNGNSTGTVKLHDGIWGVAVGIK